MNDPRPSHLPPLKQPALKRLWNATRFSMRGLAATFRHEQAFRQEIYLSVVGIPLGLWLGETGIERALLVGSLLLVLIVELLNSAVESVVDRTGIELHELSGRAKDQGSAAVLVSLIFAIATWALVLLD